MEYARELGFHYLRWIRNIAVHDSRCVASFEKMNLKPVVIDDIAWAGALALVQGAPARWALGTDGVPRLKPSPKVRARSHT